MYKHNKILHRLCFIIVLIFFCLLLGCSFSDDDILTAMSIDEPELELYETEYHNLHFMIEPQDALYFSIDLSSSDESVANFIDGTLYALSPGITTITAATSDGVLTDSLTLTVLEAIPLTSLVFSDNNLKQAVLDTGYTYMHEIDALHGGSYNISNLSGIDQLLRLHHLYMDGNQISDLTPLEQLPNLNDLRISSNLISNITSLDELTDLTILRLDTNNISDISTLQFLSKLEYLSLSHNPVEDISPIENLQTLHSLDLRSTSRTGLSSLQKLLNLKYLHLGNNSINDLTGIQYLRKLESLDLKNNSISNIDSLQDLISLEYINLANNSIFTLTALNDLINLNILNLYNNNITSDVVDLSSLINATIINLGGAGNSGIPTEDLDTLEIALGDDVVLRPDE